MPRIKIKILRTQSSLSEIFSCLTTNRQLPAPTSNLMHMQLLYIMPGHY